MRRRFLNSKVSLTGLNVQWPWSQLILSGKKTVETRRYPMPLKHLKKPIALIETPGLKGKKFGVTKAKIIGVLIIHSCFKYNSREHWVADFERHQVTNNDPEFSYKANADVWGWVIESCWPVTSPVYCPARRGIVFASQCAVSESDLTPRFNMQSTFTT